MLFNIKDVSSQKAPNNLVYLFDGNGDRLSWKMQEVQGHIQDFSVVNYSNTGLPRPSYGWIDQPNIHDKYRAYAIIIVLPHNHPLKGEPIEYLEYLHSSEWLACFVIQWSEPRTITL